MPLKVLGSVERKQRVGVEVCTAHGARCEKYPDHPLIRESVKPDMELVEMIRMGRSQLGIPDPEYPKECKPRKLSDDELRQRREHADAVRTAHQKKQLPPSWDKRDAELAASLAKHRQEVREGFGDTPSTPPAFEECE